MDKELENMKFRMAKEGDIIHCPSGHKIAIARGDIYAGTKDHVYMLDFIFKTTAPVYGEVPDTCADCGRRWDRYARTPPKGEIALALLDKNGKPIEGKLVKCPS